ncbi:MAG: hypothetical protein LBS59_00645 [Puniceicoccales bacterium]|nr:hypothetical protein [Puniceicoccales bacterium]
MSTIRTMTFDFPFAAAACSSPVSSFAPNVSASDGTAASATFRRIDDASALWHAFCSFPSHTSFTLNAIQL